MFSASEGKRRAASRAVWQQPSYSAGNRVHSAAAQAWRTMLTGMDFRHQVFANFKSRFGSSPRVYRAPGRVNLIGEHTDYNEGFVLPAAIGFSCWVGIAPRKDRKLILYSGNLGEGRKADLDNLGNRGSVQW